MRLCYTFIIGCLLGFGLSLFAPSEDKPAKPKPILFIRDFSDCTCYHLDKPGHPTRSGVVPVDFGDCGEHGRWYVIRDVDRVMKELGEGTR